MPLSPKLVCRAAPAAVDVDAALLKVSDEPKIKEGKKRAAPTEKHDTAITSKEKKAKTESTDEATASVDADSFRQAKQIRIISEGDVPDPVQTFETAPFPKKVRKALIAAGFAAPSPIQSQAWPIAVQGKDFIGVAKTGSGKTLAFLLPAFRMLSKQQPDCSNGPAVLVLAPTRELAVQIEEAASRFAEFADVSCCVVYGGVPKPPQANALRKQPQVVVGTPGRVVDLMNDGALKVSNVCFFVLDEADRMLEMGFEPQMKEIMKDVPEKRQTLLFSATWPKSIKKLAEAYLKEAVHVNVGETDELAANKAVSQEFFNLSDDEKDAKLWAIMDKFKETDKCIVFANTKRRIEKLSKDVWASGYSCAVMSGDKTQQERERGLADFTSGKSQVMFATDVCSRGLDIKDVTHVINYDMARDVEAYIHRIGRTGRAGSTGTSITFVNDDFDIPCSPALAKIAKEAGQDVPAWLERMVTKAATSKKDKLWQY
jgi:ATP-dependent RNA helicase DDX5/DBP2